MPTTDDFRACFSQIDATALRYSEETDVSKCTQYDLPPDCEVN